MPEKAGRAKKHEPAAKAKAKAGTRNDRAAVHAFLVFTVILLLMLLVIAISLKFSQSRPQAPSAGAQPAGPSSADLGGFCGTSTRAACASDADCLAGGCSGQVCQSRSEPAAATTCEWRDCYDAKAYGVTCGCAGGKCAWTK